MKALTIRDLIIMLLKEQKKGHGDYVVFVTNDEEANGYHALWYSGSTPAEMTKGNREFCENYNCDINLVEKGKDSKAYYLG